MSRFPQQLAFALDRELEDLNRYLRQQSIPEDLTLEHARLLLERAQERGREAYTRMAMGKSLQHGHGLVNAVARGKHPVQVFEEGRRATSEALYDESRNRVRINYLERIIPRLPEDKAVEGRIN